LGNRGGERRRSTVKDVEKNLYRIKEGSKGWGGSWCKGDAEKNQGFCRKIKRKNQDRLRKRTAEVSVLF